MPQIPEILLEAVGEGATWLVLWALAVALAYWVVGLTLDVNEDLRHQADRAADARLHFVNAFLGRQVRTQQLRSRGDPSDLISSVQHLAQLHSVVHESAGPFVWLGRYRFLVFATKAFIGLSAIGLVVWIALVLLLDWSGVPTPLAVALVPLMTAFVLALAASLIRIFAIHT